MNAIVQPSSIIIRETQTSSQRPLGQVLREKGLLSEDQLRITLQEQKRTGAPLGQLMIQMGFITEATLREALSESLGREDIDLSTVIADPKALELIPREFARRHALFPVSFEAATAQQPERLTIALSQPNDVVAVDQVKSVLAEAGFAHAQVQVMLAAETEISRAIDQFYGFTLSIDGILHEIETGELDYNSLANQNQFSQPVVRLVDALLLDAVRKGASDLHFEPESGFLRIRYRIDGVLRQIRAVHKKYWPAMAVRLKVMSSMNIAETRAPQDGRISLMLQGRAIDFRASVQPTTWGENFVLRVLDRQRGLVPLEQLGLRPEQLDALRMMMARPEGIILVTGPTGSGKTTTLYSVLNSLNDEGVNIMTLEDPVEYPMSLIRQTNVSDAVKLDFASGIRSLMRQDPDIILVGEIRDAETAEMALRAAMTGHQVYSTLHSNSALGAIPRLLDMNLQPDIIAGNIIGIIAQRLVRKLCVHCREAYSPSAAEATLLGLAKGSSMVLYRSVGCERCDYSGFRGRQSIMEVLRMDALLDEVIARRGLVREMREAASRSGFEPLAKDGLRRVLDGTTTLTEVARVADLTSYVPQ